MADRNSRFTVVEFLYSEPGPVDGKHAGRDWAKCDTFGILAGIKRSHLTFRKPVAVIGQAYTVDGKPLGDAAVMFAPDFDSDERANEYRALARKLFGDDVVLDGDVLDDERLAGAIQEVVEGKARPGGWLSLPVDRINEIERVLGIVHAENKKSPKAARRGSGSVGGRSGGRKPAAPAYGCLAARRAADRVPKAS